MIDSRLYWAMNTLANFFLLNLLWLITCIPLITIFPATAALFAVVRGWVRGTESGFFTPFFRHLRENFVQSLVVGVLWSVIGLILVADFLFIWRITSWVSVPLFVFFVLGLLVYLATAVYLFPVMVHFRCGWIYLIKNSFLIASSSPGMTLMCLFTVALSSLTVLYIPLSFLLIGSVTAYGLYLMCQRAFERVETSLTSES